MKRTALAALAIAALPLMAAPIATAGVLATTPNVPVPNTTKSVFVQAGATKRVVLGKVNAGTGYAWRWITRPKAPIAKGLAVRTTKAKMPGGPVVATAGVLGLSADRTTSGTLGLFAPGSTEATRTITLRITVTQDGR